MIKIKNIENGEMMQVWQTGIDKATGRIYCNGTPTAKYLEKYPLTATDEKIGEDTVLTLNDGWELVKKQRTTNNGEPKTPRKPRTKKAEPVIENEPAANTAGEVASIDSMKAEMLAKYGTMGADIFEAVCKVAKIQPSSVDAKDVQRICADMIKDIKPKTKEIAVITIDGTETGRVETPHKLLPKVLNWVKNDRVNKRQPWLFGPAGSGKSTIAEQVAKALNLPLYIYTNVQQKYEIEGFIGADGKFVETPMYQAMVHGGIVLCDEMGTWLPEPATAFNTITANRRYTFPVVGTVEAHPDFHIIAADNTTGRGGSRKYSARYKLDASTLDRFKFLEVPYTDEHDLFMAQGDVELVEFAKDMRRVLDEAQSEYECTPRALLDIATGMKIEDSEKDALYYGLCSGWNKQDIRTFAARLTCRNKYGRLFNEIADNL